MNGALASDLARQPLGPKLVRALSTCGRRDQLELVHIAAFAHVD